MEEPPEVPVQPAPRTPRGLPVGPSIGAAFAVLALSGVAFLLWTRPDGFTDTAAPAVPASAAPAATRTAPARPIAPQTAPATAAALAIPPAVETIDDSGVPDANGRSFTYVGPWQHLHGMRDGRSGGTSSRAFETGATASFLFFGDRFRLFGVEGPNGGHATVQIDGRLSKMLDFYAPQKRAGIEMYVSPLLETRTHVVDIIVEPAPAGFPKRRFVNIDGAAYSSR